MIFANDLLLFLPSGQVDNYLGDFSFLLNDRLWHPSTQMWAINFLNLQMSHLNVSNMII